MKRFLIALIIFTAGATAFSGLQSARSRLAEQSSTDGLRWISQTQELAAAEAVLVQLQGRVKELKLAVAQQRQTTDGLPEEIAPGPGPIRLSPEASEKLLAELGYNWNSTGEYLVVSKDTLRDISVSGMKGLAVSDAACQLLAITPQERARLDATTKQIGEDYRRWAEIHIERTEPSGDVLAKYTRPPDTDFFQNLSNRFATGMLEVLGAERGELLKQYSISWMMDLGMYQAGLPAGPTTLVVKKYPNGDPSRLTFDLRQAGSTMSTDVSPWQPFPEAFRALFPGGWKDLAAREGFNLPKEFQPKN